MSVASKSLATDRFSVDLFSAASRSKTQRASANQRRWLLGPRATLTVWDAHDGLFDRVTAGHSLLEALGPLLQEPLSCCHLQLPANTVTTEWLQLAPSICLKLTNPPKPLGHSASDARVSTKFVKFKQKQKKNFDKLLITFNKSICCSWSLILSEF